MFTSPRMTALALLAVSLSPLAATGALAEHHDGKVSAAVIDTSGANVGQVDLEQTPAGVLIKADVTGLTPGAHGFHIHETGTCDPADGFKSAGGHFAPGANSHGLMVEGGPHGGDMPNQTVGADGHLQTQVLNTGVTLMAGETSIHDGDGSALVIHEGADDYTSQPSGAAGSRVACAVLSAPK
ncbi:superoxide dismutase family protein [Novosphingobium sp. BW1]|uniref:superoxide dismutase family protein n=1 Tax=Novosphingobium sp. BW1 TaxID=2592621 RepID=UPI0011DEAB42|nr:superoxide dismutase family protein [Novosphingobium sp. BW1]TYC90665.1 superoxide dismutase family protein [Novosphingobium sp. BW1]